MSEIDYANLPSRIKAAFIDSIVLIGMMYLASEIFSFFHSIPNYVRIIVSIFIFILYEPLFVSFFGTSIGHSQSNISVKKENKPNQNINFPMAIIRFILKTSLGWISLITTTSNSKRKAIHDYVAQSIVIENSTD